MRNQIEDMVNDNHKDFVKVIISVEKGINDVSSSLAKIKLQKDRLKVSRTLPPILPITVSISSQESSCLRAK